MPEKYGRSIDLNKNSIKNIVIDTLATAPNSASSGQMFYNINSNKMNYFSGTSWIDLSNSTINTTLANIQSLISKSKIIPNAHYLITNPSAGGQILLTGASTSGLYPDGVWLRPTTLYPFGCISLRSGTAGGYISNIKVNGVAINGAKVNFTTNLVTTTTNLATNINAHSASTGFSAVGIQNYLIVKSTTATASLNGQVISGSSGGITLGNALPLAHGQNPWTMKLFCLYDATGDKFSMVCDTPNTTPANNGNNVLCTAVQLYYTSFPWGDSRYNDNAMLNGSIIYNNYIYGSGVQIYFNSLNTASTFLNNFFYRPSGNFLITGNTMLGQTGISGNVIFSNSTGATTFQYNTLDSISSITNNVFECSGSSVIQLSGNYLLANNTTISSNTATITTGVMGIVYNNLLSNTTQINSNAWTAPFVIQENVLMGSKAVINSNTFSGSATGDNTNGNLADNTLNAYCEISGNIFSGANTYMNFNSLSNSTTTVANAGITNCTLSGSGNQITNCETLGSVITGLNFNSVTNAILSNITIYKPGQTWGNFTMDKSYSGIVWNEDDTYNITSTVTGMTATANNGLSNSPISLSYVPQKFYALEAYIEGSSITSSSSGATINIGMVTDNLTAFLPSTSVSSLNATITVGTVTRTKATAFRQVVAVPHATNITGGTLKLILKGALGI